MVYIPPADKKRCLVKKTLTIAMFGEKAFDYSTDSDNLNNLNPFITESSLYDKTADC